MYECVCVYNEVPRVECDDVVVVDVDASVHLAGCEGVTCVNVSKWCGDSLLLGFNDGSARVIRLCESNDDVCAVLICCLYDE